jgi:hypothetical protein
VSVSVSDLNILATSTLYVCRAHSLLPLHLFLSSSLKDLLIVLPVHFVCALSTFMILKLLLPVNMASVALAPISYSEDNAWLVVR